MDDFRPRKETFSASDLGQAYAYAYAIKVVNFKISPHQRFTGEIIGKIISPVKKLVKCSSIRQHYEPTHYVTFCGAIALQYTMNNTYSYISQWQGKSFIISDVFLPLLLPPLLLLYHKVGKMTPKNFTGESNFHRWCGEIILPVFTGFHRWKFTTLGEGY